MEISINQQTASVGKDVEKPSVLLVEMQIGVATVETVEIPQKIQKGTTL